MISVNLDDFAARSLPVYDRDLFDFSRGQWVYLGSRKSAKTHFVFEQRVLVPAMLFKLNIGFVRKTRCTIKDGMLKVFKNLVEKLGLSGICKFYEEKIVFNNGSVINIYGLDKPSKLKTLEFDLVIYEEMEESEENDFLTLVEGQRGDPVVREDGLVFDKQFIGIMNPPEDFNHWTNVAFFTPNEKTGLVKYPKVLTLRTTVYDNPFVTQAEIDELEAYKITDYNRYLRNCLAQFAMITEGLIFKHKINWDIISAADYYKALHLTKEEKEIKARYGKIKYILEDSELYDIGVRIRDVLSIIKGYGLDVSEGGGNDPFVSIEINADPVNRILYCRQVLWDKNLDDSSKYLDAIKRSNSEKGLPHIIDSAAGSKVNDIRNAGYEIHKCKKGAGSVNAGIENLKTWKVLIREDSTDLIEEYQKYSWEKIPNTNQYKNTPVDKYNHGIDSMRYFEEYLNRVEGV